MSAKPLKPQWFQILLTLGDGASMSSDQDGLGLPSFNHERPLAG